MDVSVLRPSSTATDSNLKFLQINIQVENWGVNNKKGVIEWEYRLRKLKIEKNRCVIDLKEGEELGGRRNPTCVNGYSSI